MESKTELRKRAMGLEPIIRIGKNGITDSAVSEIRKQLKKKKLVKVKMLRAFIEGKGKKESAEEIAGKTGSEIIDLVGFVVVLWKP